MTPDFVFDVFKKVDIGTADDLCKFFPWLRQHFEYHPKFLEWDKVVKWAVRRDRDDILKAWVNQAEVVGSTLYDALTYKTHAPKCMYMLAKNRRISNCTIIYLINLVQPSQYIQEYIFRIRYDHRRELYLQNIHSWLWATPYLKKRLLIELARHNVFLYIAIQYINSLDSDTYLEILEAYSGDQIFRLAPSGNQRLFKVFTQFICDRGLRIECNRIMFIMQFQGHSESEVSKMFDMCSDLEIYGRIPRRPWCDSTPERLRERIYQFLLEKGLDGNAGL